MIDSLILTAAFWIHYLIVLTVIYLLKEKMAWQPKPYGILDFYPFLCRKCLTMWTLIASYISIGIIIAQPLYAVFGTILGAGTGYAIHYTEKERLE